MEKEAKRIVELNRAKVVEYVNNEYKMNTTEENLKRDLVGISLPNPYGKRKLSDRQIYNFFNKQTIVQLINIYENEMSEEILVDVFVENMLKKIPKRMLKDKTEIDIIERLSFYRSNDFLTYKGATDMDVLCKINEKGCLKLSLEHYIESYHESKSRVFLFHIEIVGDMLNNYKSKRGFLNNIKKCKDIMNNEYENVVDIYKDIYGSKFGEITIEDFL